MVITHKEGVCPHCQSENIEYGDLEIEMPTGIYYKAQCSDCGTTFNEWYDVNFAGHYNIQEN